MVCGAPSSRMRKFSFLRPGMNVAVLGGGDDVERDDGTSTAMATPASGGFLRCVGSLRRRWILLRLRSGLRARGSLRQSGVLG